MQSSRRLKCKSRRLASGQDGHRVGVPGAVPGMIAAALSGAVSGVFLAGYFSLSGMVIVAAATGAVLGWRLRGLSV